ncbi:zinc finger protein [Parasponia andersonii]|uniref:Zinc finger protein n=1 Tax=Parasponia andersonii TaxID=3476 RepID=A0A2P5AJ93_PARAD|nr:zinc finger protein [Parasponia andersonii]
MAFTPLSLLLLRRLSISSSSPKFSLSSLSHLLNTTAANPFSTAPTPSSSSSSSSDPNPSSSLSARLSFVFDQIDAIEKERSEKDETLQRIRAWRESKKAQQKPELGSESATNGGASVSNAIASDSAVSYSTEPPPPVSRPERSFGVKSEVELVHPWPEWLELMERLVQQNYFDHRRKDEDKMIQELGFDAPQDAPADSAGLDFKNFKLVQTACLNFGKDRFDILRSLSRQDIQILVGFGCPSADKKVVFSAKLLRKHVHLDEGDVCSSCSLRNSCDRAYLFTLKEDEARTIDIMRVLLAYGFDPLNASLVNQSLLKKKSVKTVVRKLLHEVVKLSLVPIDPNLPPPIIKKPAPKVKQPPPPPKKRVGRDDIEMKKGDWLCPKCDFMNFARNNVCLQCDAKRPKRQLLPGEWECPQCNFLNYRRNTVCFHCDCKRPPDELMENKMQEKYHGPKVRLEKTTNRSEISNAWNFDFDDDESDGADVAAFEYADSSAMGEGSSLDDRAQGGNFGRPEYDFNKASREPMVRDGEYSDADIGRPGIGFDDFDDEEDDIDNYELDTGNGSSVPKVSSNDFSDFEGYSGSEDSLQSDKVIHAHHRTKSSSYDKQAKSIRRRAFSGSDSDDLDLDSESELSANPKWKSSHVADFRPRGRGSIGPSKRLSFGSDDEAGLYSDMDDDLNHNFGSKRGKATDLRRRKSPGFEDDRFPGSESEDDDLNTRRNRFRGKVDSNRNGKGVKGRSNYNFTKDTKFRSNGMKNGRRNSFKDDDDDFDGSLKGYKSKGFKGNNSKLRMSDRGGDRQNFKGRKSGGFGMQRDGRRNAYDRDMNNRDSDEFKNRRRHNIYDRNMDKDFDDFKNKRRVIER